MTEPERAQTAERHLLSERRARLAQLVGAPLRTPRGPATPPERRAFLREEAEELYWNELSWEKLTDEEMQGGSELVELTFPAFLSFIDGLLLREVPDDSPAAPNPRPDVVEDVLDFLAGLCLHAAASRDARDPARAPDPGERGVGPAADGVAQHGAGAHEELGPLEAEMTSRLIDLVLYRLHGVEVEGLDPLSHARRDEDE